MSTYFLKKCHIVFGLGMMFVLFVLDSLVFAREFYVAPDGNGTNCTEVEPCQFSTALDAAKENFEDDTIILKSGNYTITEPLLYYNNNGDGNLTIRAEDLNNPPVLDGGNSTLILYIHTDFDGSMDGDEGDVITLLGIIFKRGKLYKSNNYYWPGGLFLKTGSAPVRIGQCSFFENLGALAGGAYVETDSGSITISDSIFQSNAVFKQSPDLANDTGHGGGLNIQTNSGHIDLKRCSFSDNFAALSGGGVYGTYYRGTLVTESCTFTDNQGKNGGGAYFHGGSYGSSANIVIKKSSFESNEAEDEGGGLYLYADNSANVTECSFVGNVSENDSGGADIGVYSGIVSLENSKFINNTSKNGKGGGASVGSYEEDVYIKHSLFNGNLAQLGGGVAGGSAKRNVFLLANIFENNNSTARGGGAAIGTFSGNITAVNNIFFHNKSQSDGGGLVAGISAESLWLTNNTIYENNALGDGGGVVLLAVSDNSTTDVFNNIIFGNSASGQGNDIFVDPDFEGELMGFNVEDDGNDFGGHVNLFNNDLGLNSDLATGQSLDLFIKETDQYSHAGNIMHVPSLVAPDSGDFHLAMGSACINKGTVTAPALPETDFEGDPRKVGDSVDIGADEFNMSYTPCDPNGDGKINVLDVITTINIILNQVSENSADGGADCNRDGKVNVLDVISIINKILQIV